MKVIRRWHTHQITSYLRSGSFGLDSREVVGREDWYRYHKDYLDIKEQYETLFLIGSKEVFVNISIDSREVRDEGRNLYLRYPGYHAHEHIDYYERRKHTKDYKPVGWSLCLDFYDRELWER